MTDNPTPTGPQKIGVTIPISNELVSQGAFMPPNWLAMAMGLEPDTRTEAEKRADRNRRDAEARQRRAAAEAEHAAILAAADPFRRAVLELHAPVFDTHSSYPHCDGCDMEGYECESPSFPCRTYSLAANWPEGGLG